METPTTPKNNINSLIDITRQELTIPEIIAGAWKIFSERLQAIVLITIAVFLPINLISSLLTVKNSPASAPSGLAIVGLVISGLLVMFVGVLVPLATAHITRAHLDNQSVDFKTAVRFALSKWGGAFITSLLVAIFLIGLAFLLVIPAIILGVYWAFAAYVVALKGQSGMAALRYSKAVVQGRWWKVAGYLFVFGLITGLIGWLIGLPFVTIHSPVVNALVSTLSDIVSSFTVVATAIFFINLDNVRRTKPTNT